MQNDLIKTNNHVWFQNIIYDMILHGKLSIFYAEYRICR